MPDQKPPEPKPGEGLPNSAGTQRVEPTYRKERKEQQAKEQKPGTERRDD